MIEGIREFDKRPDPVFKTVQGWEEHQLLPVLLHKNRPSSYITLALIGACLRQDTDKKRQHRFVHRISG